MELAKMYKENFEAINEAYFGYAQGELTLEEANEKLEAIDPAFKLEIGKNKIKPEEMRDYCMADFGVGAEKIGVLVDEKGLKLNQNLGNVIGWADYCGAWFKIVDGERLEFDPEITAMKASEKK